MKTKLLLLCAGLLFAASADGQVSSTGVSWSCKVFTSLGLNYEKALTVNGGEIDHTGIRPCVQAPLRRFRDSSGNLQEEVRITCEVGVSGKASLVQTCFAGKPDSSFGAMRVDNGYENYTVSLACHR